MSRQPTDFAHAQAMRIVRAIAEGFGLTLVQLRTRHMHTSVLGPKWIAMYLVRTVAKMSFPQVAHFFGGRHHTTVLHACRETWRRFDEAGRGDELLALVELAEAL